MAERGPASPVTMVTSVPFALLLCATLGMAPFLPEPHLVGKLRWVAGGGVGMTATDVFDLAWHGWPFVWLVVTLVMLVRRRRAS